MKPILFNTEMVRAILDGRKTATRRVVKPQPAGDGSKPEPLTTRPGYWNTWDDDYVYHQPYQIGDILYVRETWSKDNSGEYVYRTNYGTTEDDSFPPSMFKWHPPINMPKEAARLFLRVTDVRVERLKDITDEQAIAEGVPDNCDYPLDNPVYCPVCKGEGLIGAAHPVSLGYMEVDCPHCDTPRKRFANLWNSTIKPADRNRYGWDANPWVWVIEFERCEKPKGDSHA